MNALEPLSVELSATHLIEASAGTGKTYTITTLYLRLVIESGLDVSEILVVTYTKAATAELRQRVRDRLREALERLEARPLAAQGESSRSDDLDELLERALADDESGDVTRTRLVRALTGFDEASIFTIHGFCQRVLQDNAFESGVPFESELLTDPRPLLREVAEDFWTRELYAAPPVLVRHLMGLKLARRSYGPALLADLAARIVTHPDTTLLPDRPEPSIDAHGEAWERALSETKALWEAARREVLGLLCAGDALHGGSYKPERIMGVWAPAMDALFAAPRPGLGSIFEKFENFTPAVLQKRTKQGGVTPTHPFFEACGRLLELDLEYVEALNESVLALCLDFTDYARGELARRKLDQRTQTFDDLLQRLAGALEAPGSAALAARVRGQFRAALIDEFQDTDPLQYRIFRTIWHEAGAPLFLIGDPKQAIYAFRGADVFAYMGACEDAGEERRYTLGTNWRSDPSLIEAVNTLFEGSVNPFVFERIPFEPASPRPDAIDALGGVDAAALRLLFVGKAAWKATSTSEARKGLDAAVAADVARLLRGDGSIEGRPIQPGDVALLCRTNRQAMGMQAALSRVGVPSVVQGDQSVFESREAEELERVLRAVSEPADLGAVRAALTTSLLGVSGPELHTLGATDDGLDPWLERFHAWHACWQSEGTIALLHRLFADHDVQRRLLALGDGERRLTNLLHLAELLQATALQAGAGSLGLVSWLGRMRADVEARAQGVGDAAQLRLESDARAVMLVTIHKSKGLEYPIVYCPFPWEGALLMGLSKEWVGFHDPDAGDAQKLDLGSDARDRHRSLAEREALAESLRLLYVALTRAKHQLVVVWATAKDWRTSALGYLLHAPESVARPGAVAPDALAETLGEALKQLSEDEVRADLQRWVDAANGGVQLADLELGLAATLASEAPPAPTLEARAFDRSLAAHWRTSSFSGLVAGGVQTRVGAAVLPAAEGYDFDAPLPLALAEGAAGAGAGDRLVRLHDFPAGTGPGTMIHEVFEHLDFEGADDQAIADQVERSASRHGVDRRFAPTLCRAIREQLDTPLGGGAGALSLSGISRQRRIDEMEFVFPVSSAGAERLTPVRLAQVMSGHASRPLVKRYADRVAALTFMPLEGYLRGFIDLIFEWDDRYYVVDYKSNRLGPSPEHYAAAQLDAPMLEHDYLLQYHVYAVALHRYLQRSLADYDYERHMGGVYYLFLRGMAPEHSEGCGVFYDRPPQALVEGLSALFGEGGSR
jgi:exodeoxyribonuclease V beta subunit